MPKPLFGDNGSYAYPSVALEEGTNLSPGKKFAGLSEMALYYIGSILKHAKAMAAFTNPTVIATSD
jgi:glutamine synthetase